MKLDRVIFLPLLTLPVSGALVWTGGGDGISLYQESNWQDDLGNTPGANTINPNTVVTAQSGGSVEITSGNGSPSNFGGTFILPVGNDLTIDNGKVLGGGSPVEGGGAGSLLSIGIGSTARASSFSQFSEVTINGGVLRSNSTGGFTTAAGLTTIAVSNGGSLDLQFISGGWLLTLDSSSSANLKGGGNPLNNGDVELAPGAVVSFTAETPGAFTSEHLSKFTVNGATAEIGTNLQVISDGGTGAIVTAIPEPSSLLLGALGLISLVRRKR